MKARCPYCKQVFEPTGENQCPHCRKTVLMRNFAAGSESLGVKRKLNAPAWTPRAALRHNAPSVSILAGQPFLIILAIIVLMALGGALIKKTHRPPPATDVWKESIARENLDLLRIALNQLREESGRFPSTEEGLVALIHNPGMQGWNGPYILQLKPDPWRRPFGYSCDGSNISVFSTGADGLPETSDDVLPP